MISQRRPNAFFGTTSVASVWDSQLTPGQVVFSTARAISYETVSALATVFACLACCLEVQFVVRRAERTLAAAVAGNYMPVSQTWL